MALAIHEGRAVDAMARAITAFVVVGGVILAASLFGILTRPFGSLAALWPANAILLGLMVRNSDLASIWGWSGAFAGYLVADLVTGGSFGITLWLTFANMAGAFTGYLLLSALDEEDRRLRRPQSVLYLFATCAAAALVAAVAGGGAARLLFNRDFAAGLEFWFVTELVNGLVILPVILTFPGLPAVHATLQEAKANWREPGLLAPIISLITTLFISLLVGGPGAVAFPVPALLWCALSYGLFATALLSFMVCGWSLIVICTNQAQFSNDFLAATSSMRLGVALIAVAPLTAASINNARTELLAKLKRAADYDHLTGILGRRAFMERAAALVGAQELGARMLAVLVLDIDHFKQINDRHGHAAGDAVLVAFTQAVSSVLRPEDLFGRTGGEEFAIVLNGMSGAQASVVAERIRRAVKMAQPIVGSTEIPITVSIGIATSEHNPSGNLDTLMGQADDALYEAKRGGRDRVVMNQT